MIYLDNAATTFPKPESVYAVMDQTNRQEAVNAGRGGYKLAQKASRLISETKDLLRKLVHVDSNVAVVFAPSVTIAMNQIVHGLQLQNGANIYVSPYDHNAVARSVHACAKKKNLIVHELPMNEALEIDLERLKYEFSRNKPAAVFCTHVSNVTGYILPVEEIFSETKKHGGLTILDAAQSIGLVDIRADLIGADLIAFAGHKTLYGPLGIGGFINVSGVELDTFIAGGTGSDSLNLEMPKGNENKFEAASPNVVAIAGLNAALKWINPAECLAWEKELTEYLINRISQIKGIRLLLPENADRHVGIVSFTMQGYSSEDVGMLLDEDYDIAVRTGYHCAPYIHKYLKDESTHGTVRVGVGKFTTRDDIDKLVDALIELRE